MRRSILLGSRVGEELIARAAELGCFPDPENYTDEQLRDAIAAEEAATALSRTSRRRVYTRRFVKTREDARSDDRQ